MVLIIVVAPVEAEDESEMVPEKWFKGVIVIVDEPALPELTCTAEGFAMIV